ncbi:MAG: hypothetical protein JNL98_35095 [Bryobacterales bacterium]|nr:hypothetical protein [Bryobacterales bacterium]
MNNRLLSPKTASGRSIALAQRFLTTRIAGALILAIAATAAHGQVPRSHGYVVQGFGQVDSNAFGHTAFGGEGAVWKGVSVGGEIGAAYGLGGKYPPTIGFANLSAGYHFTAGRKDTKFDPFVMTGPTLAFRNGTGGGWHLGAGLNYWFKERVGLRAEFRTNAITSDLYHWPQFRVGITFR